MDIKQRAALKAKAIKVLQSNDLGGNTQPAPTLYPHQWFWDSCFIAIGLRHVDMKRAKQEIVSLFDGQWDNGMFPHVKFSKSKDYHAGPETWRSELVSGSPKKFKTSGITQPPVLAEAVVRLGEKLSDDDRASFYKQTFPHIVKYHTWLYTERDPHQQGLVTLIHPWESGLDNTPYWMKLTYKAAPLNVRALRLMSQDRILDRMRKDTKTVPASERLSAGDLYTLYHLQAQLMGHDYKLENLYKDRIPLVQDLVFNAILIRANEHVRTIAKEIGAHIPQGLAASMDKSTHAFETLFDDGYYWSRNFRTRDLIKEPTIATFLALYAGSIPQEHADKLADVLQRPYFWDHYGIATTPSNSKYFKELCYWQGPIWNNMNWMIADGLERYGHKALATSLRQQTIRLVNDHGMFEYFSMHTGRGAGTDNFSWTAALTIDLLALHE